jgi:hypothetical protein
MDHFSVASAGAGVKAEGLKPADRILVIVPKGQLTTLRQTRLYLRRMVAARVGVAVLLAVIGVHFHPMINHSL